MIALLSTLQGLPDDARAEVERSLLPLARAAALGSLAADVGHDVGNALFGLVGLVDLALDGTPIDEERARLIRRAEHDVEAGFRPLLAFARGGAETGRGELGEAVAQALAVFRHGSRKHCGLLERSSEGPERVACPPGPLLDAVVHVLLATDPAARELTLEVGAGTVEVGPAGEESIHTLAASRIAADHGGALEREGAVLRLRLPRA